MSFRPLVSLLVPVFNQVRGLAWLYRSLLAHTPEPPWELILVDNGSTEPGITSFYADVGRSERVTILRQPVNLGFGRANNLALAASRGDYVVLINSDLFVTTTWLPALIERLQSTPECAAVQAKLLLPAEDLPATDWKTQTCGSRLDASGLPQYHLAGRPREEAAVNCPMHLPVFMGTAVALRREAMVAVGGFDEAYDLVFMEDTDLALRLVARGHLLVYEPRSTLVHWHGASMPYLEQAVYDRCRTNNLRLYRERWPVARIRPLMADRGFPEDPEQGWFPRPY